MYPFYVNNQGSFGKFFAIFAQTFASFAVKKRFISNSFLLVFFTTSSIVANGQRETLSQNITEIAEELAANEEDPGAVSILIDRLQELTENPVKLNSAQESEISKLFFLSDFQVKALTDYAHTSGQIVSVYELANIPGFDRETVEMIIPFISLEFKIKNDSDSVRWRNSIITNFSEKPGTNDSSFLGSGWKMLTRYKFAAGGFSGGLTAEKDPGEKLLAGTPPLPDFLSTYIAYAGNGVIKRIIIGDYSARFGQGTNINTSIRKGISLVSPGYMSASDEIKPYTSTDENNFFRGFATEFSIKNLELSIFFSKNYSDATITASSDSTEDYIENFYTAGVHNTTSLLLKKDKVYKLTSGLAVSYDFRNLKVGLLWSDTRLSHSLMLNKNDPWRTNDFTGNRNSLYTAYYNSLIKKIILYGEISADNNRKYAFVQGFSFRPSDRLSINLIYRNYTPGYTTFYGHGPGSGSKTANEKGFLGSFSFEAAKHLFISGGCDIEHFPWLKYRCSSPSLGVRKEIKVRYLMSEKVMMDASYDYRFSMVDKSDTQGIPDQDKVITRSIKALARYSIHENLILGTRIDYKIANPGESRGYSLYQELNYSIRHIPLTIWVRYCIFNTDDWYSRIYTYENDLLYSYSIPALYGEGSRSYIMAKWKITDFAELRIKYGITSAATPGKSPENTEEIKIQFRIWF